MYGLGEQLKGTLVEILGYQHCPDIDDRMFHHKDSLYRQMLDRNKGCIVPIEYTTISGTGAAGTAMHLIISVTFPDGTGAGVRPWEVRILYEPS